MVRGRGRPRLNGRGRGGRKSGRKKNDGETSDLSFESTKSRSGEESTIQAEEKAGGSGRGRGRGRGRRSVIGRGRGGQNSGWKKKDGETSDLSFESTKSRSGEESTIKVEENADAGGGGRFFACYLLTSLSPRYKDQTYIGYTVNPRRRIRQHNGEISSGAMTTRMKRPWEMVLCIYGFPTNVSALKFEWAWQHPMRSINTREAASTMTSITGLADNIKIAYKMLNLPAWNRLNMTVNIFSSKYTVHSAGIDLPNHMKSQIGSMDDLPCYTDENGGGFFHDYNHDELDGEEDDLSDGHVREDDDDGGGGDKDISPSKTLYSSVCGGEQVWLTDETLFQLVDENSGGFFDDYYNHDELIGEEDYLSDKHVRADEDGGDKDISPLKTLYSSECGGEQVWLTDETLFQLVDENGGGSFDDYYNHDELIGEEDDLSDKHVRADEDGGDKDISPLKTLSSKVCRGEKEWLTNETRFNISGDDDDNDTTRHENGGSISDKIETHIREDDDDGDKNMSPLKTLSSSLCGGKKVWFELSDDDDGDNRNCIIPIDKTHEVDVIDLLSPSPVRKKKRIMMDVIDLTQSPIFV